MLIRLNEETWQEGDDFHGRQESIPGQAQQSITIRGAYVSPCGCKEAECIPESVPLWWDSEDRVQWPYRTPQYAGWDLDYGHDV